MNWEIIGFIGATCTTFCFLPQIFKAYKTKSTGDISYVWLIMLLVGVAAWLIYGLGVSDRVIIIANAITLLLGFILLGMKIKYQ